MNQGVVVLILGVAIAYLLYWYFIKSVKKSDDDEDDPPQDNPYVHQNRRAPLPTDVTLFVIGSG